ncbi:DUF1232 domain-containing protein [bacterium]|nr:DUF1232 domain-containing protein [bacterium]
MNLNDFKKSKWVKNASDPKTQQKILDDFSGWVSKVKNIDIAKKAKQLYGFFVSPKISVAQKAIIAGALLYIISPIDLIPDFIPVIGWLDDLSIAGIVLNYIFSEMDRIELEDIGDGNVVDERKN